MQKFRTHLCPIKNCIYLKKSVLIVKNPLTGVRNGKKTGSMYNIAQSAAREQQNNRELPMTNSKHTSKRVKPMHIVIIIPARYHSTRLPGKPLVQIAGTSMLQRVWFIAQMAIQQTNHHDIVIEALVTTEDQRIVDQCIAWNIPCLLTSDQCRSGTERVAQACSQLEQKPDFIINLQGDNALCPPWFLNAMIDTFYSLTINDTSTDAALSAQHKTDTQAILPKKPGVITPYVKLNWQALDHLRQEKELTPFSGTCVVMNQKQQAIWFSKNIIPALRNEKELRKSSSISPIARHIGLYGYDAKTLDQILTLQETQYEALEGLEQLSFIEANIPIHLVEVDYRGRQGMTGIDSPEDIARAEMIIQTHGEF